MSDEDALVFGGIADYLDQALDLGLGVQGHTEELNGRVVDVVIGGDHSQVQRRRVDIVVYGYTLALLKVVQS